MAIELKVDGNGRWVGLDGKTGNLANYSYNEESTPLGGADSSGASGQFEVSVISDSVPDAMRFMSDSMTLTDQSNGVTTGTVTGISYTNKVASLTVSDRLSLLQIDATIPPYNGSLTGALVTYFGLAGVTVGVEIDPSFNSRNVTYPGWFGNLWEWLKWVCVVEQIEIALVSNSVVARQPRQRTAGRNHMSAEQLSSVQGDLALNVEVVNYSNQWKTNSMVYPKGGTWNADLDVIQVDAGQELEVEIPIDVSLLSIEQPSCVSFLPRDYVGPSAYCVAGDDGLPIPPAQWLDDGGSVEVRIGEDTKTLIVKVRGANQAEYAPYSLAVTAGPSDQYSALRIRGTGVHFEQTTHKYATGADPKLTRQDVGTTVDIPLVSNQGQVAHLAYTASGKYAMPNATLSISALTLNRSGEPGELTNMTFGEFDAHMTNDLSLTTFASFGTHYSGYTFADLDEYIRSFSAYDFENQAFGNVGGAIVRMDHANYRIRSATIEPTGISATAEISTTFGEFSEKNVGLTFEQFSTKVAGMTFNELSLIPLV